MKKLISMLLVIVMMTTLCCSFAIGAGATDTAKLLESVPDVRVNGDLVKFPDGQPYINSDNRTLIPVRFVSEALGANVTWVESTSTAVMEKNGIKVEVTIGQKNITVTKNGTASTVAMDTMAVLRYDRTYVPIRFVAENLGAWVSFSNYYNTVQIAGCDTLTAAEIKELHAMTAKAYTNKSAMPGNSSAYFKAYEAGEYGQENMNEYIYRNLPKGILSGQYSQAEYYPGASPTSDVAKVCIEEAQQYLDITINGLMTSNVKLTFKTDVSCVIREPMSTMMMDPRYVVAGYLTIDIPANASQDTLTYLREKFVTTVATPDVVSFEAGKSCTFKTCIGIKGNATSTTFSSAEGYVYGTQGMYA